MKLLIVVPPGPSVGGVRSEAGFEALVLSRPDPQEKNAAWPASGTKVCEMFRSRIPIVVSRDNDPVTREPVARMMSSASPVDPVFVKPILLTVEDTARLWLPDLPSMPCRQT